VHHSEHTTPWFGAEIKIFRALSRTHRVAVEPQISNELFDALILKGHLPKQRVEFV